MTLTEVAEQTDRTVTQARAELVQAVRQAAASGMTQARIAEAIGRSQPEVHRLLHFHGTSPLALRLRRQANRIRQLVSDAGGRNVRVFGSVATGEDGPGSDVDLLFTMGTPLSMMRLEALSRQIGALLGVETDLVPDSSIRPDFRDRILSEAVPL